MRSHGPEPLPFPGFFFEGSAIFAPAAENIGNLRNEACKHGLPEAVKDERAHTHTHEYNMKTMHIRRKPSQNKTAQHVRHTSML